MCLEYDACLASAVERVLVLDDFAVPGAFSDCESALGGDRDAVCA